MKIECPSCHLTGNMHEIDIPPEGRYFDCPRCKTGFHIAKPAPSADSGHLMNTCPVCQYSTFTEEMFSSCPKCGATAVSYKEMLRKRAEREQMLHDEEVLNRSMRNPELILPPVGSTSAAVEPEQVKPKVPRPIMVISWLCIAAGALILCYGMDGLSNYYGKDWQAVLSVPFIEPVSKIRIFFSLGLLPWLHTMYAAGFIAVASQFLMLRPWAPRGMTMCAWGGVGLGVINGIAAFVNYIKIASSSPSFTYCALGVISSLFMILLWSAPFLALLWYLQKESILREFPEK
jgi:hypothetical protein